MASGKIYIDSRWVDKADAKVSVFDHGVLYGDGIFEGIRAYHGHVFRLRRHLERLYRSAKAISLEIPMSIEKMTDLVLESIKRNELSDAYIRLLVTRGVGDLGLDPRVCGPPNVIIIADQIKLFPEHCYKDGLDAVFVKTRRNIPEALNPRIKSMNYLNNILAKIEANEHDVPEGIMLNIQGYVSECTGDNVFFVKGEEIVTPPVSAGVLEGITREAVIELVLKKSEFRFTEKLFRPEELMRADEIFFTGTAAEVIPVTTIDTQPIGSGNPGPVTLNLMREFKDLIRSEAG